MKQRTEDELMELGASGDDLAFRELVERWEGPIYAFLSRMLDSREEAQDLCQETFLRMVRSAGGYRPTGQFRGWLFRIAANLARSRMRRGKILRWLPFQPGLHDPPTREPDAQQAMENAELRSELRAAIMRLPERQREAIVLKQFHELRYLEIAQVMGTTTDSVQMLLHRAMTALRRDLARKEEGP